MKRALILNSETESIQANYRRIENLPLVDFHLICVLGKDCSAWEGIVDEILVGSGASSDNLPVTTSHPNESLPEVEKFAKSFFGQAMVEVQHEKL